MGISSEKGGGSGPRRPVCLGSWETHDATPWALARSDERHGLHVTGRLLGHWRASSTNRYGHLDDATSSRAAERVGSRLLESWARRSAEGCRIPWPPSNESKDPKIERTTSWTSSACPTRKAPPGLCELKRKGNQDNSCILVMCSTSQSWSPYLDECSTRSQREHWIFVAGRPTYVMGRSGRRSKANRERRGGNVRGCKR